MMCLSALGQYAATNSSPIIINDATPVGAASANPYPSVIDLTGSTILGALEKITVTVNLGHQYSRDVGLLLVAPNGKATVLMNHAGTTSFTNSITFDAASNSIPSGVPLVAGAYAPTDLSTNSDPRLAALGFGEDFVTNNLGSAGFATNWVTLTKLAQSLTGLTTNQAAGQWKLYVQDDTLGNTGVVNSVTLNLYTGPVFASVPVSVITTENSAATNLMFTLLSSSPVPAAGYTVTVSGPALGSMVTTPSPTTSGLSGTLPLTPVTNTFGASNYLTITVTDGPATIQTNVGVIVTHLEQLPTIALATNKITVAQGQMSQVISATVFHADNSNLTFVVSSDNPNIVSPSGVFFAQNPLGSGTYTSAYTNSFVVVPEGDAVGTANLTISVNDGGTKTNTAALAVTVNAASALVKANTNAVTLSVTGTNSAVHVTAAGLIAKPTLTLNGLSGVDPGTLNVTLTNSAGKSFVLYNQTKTLTTRNYSQIIFDDSGSDTLPKSDTTTNTLRVSTGGILSSLTNYAAGDTWTLLLSDGQPAQLTGGWLFSLYVAPVVTLASTNITIQEAGTSNITFTVSDLTGTVTNKSNVQLAFVSSATPGLIGISGLAFNPATGVGTATLTANYTNYQPQQFGSGIVTVAVTDTNGYVGTNSYIVTVPFLNHQPTVSFIPKQVSYNGEPTDPIQFSVDDVDNPTQTLSVSVSSDNWKLLPSTNIIVTPTTTPNHYTLTLYPIGSVADNANITITVDDGQKAANSVNTSVFQFYAAGPANNLFDNTNTTITIPAGKVAGPYPSQVTVTNLIGAVGKVTVTLFDLTYFTTNLSGLNVLLVSPAGGTNAALLLGGLGDVTNSFGGTTLVFEDGNANLPAHGPLVSGTYAPTWGGALPVNPAFPNYTNYTGTNVVPAAPYTTNLATAFNGLSGANLNGTWSLYVNNTNGLGKGEIIYGWQLNITTTPNVQAPNDLIGVKENSAKQTIKLTVGDVQVGGDISVATSVAATGGSLSPSITASNWQDNSGVFWLDITPIPYMVGSNKVSIIATMGAYVSSNSFLVTVTPQILPPVVVSAVTNITIARATYGSSTFLVWDPQGAVPFTVSPRSLDPSVQVVGATVGPAVNDKGWYPVTVTVLPNTDQYTTNGPVTINVVVTDATNAPALTTNFTVKVIQGGPLFFNTDSSAGKPITIPTGYPLSSNATPFPSTNFVQNLNGTVSGVEVTLVGFQHQHPADVDVLLVSPDGVGVVLMAHAGGVTNTPAGGVRLTFDQSSQNILSATNALVTGTYQPTNFVGALSFAPPVPAGNPAGVYSNSLAAFLGGHPNGTWSLFVMDDTVDNAILSNTSGTIDNWILSLQTSPAIVPIAAQATLENTPIDVHVQLISDVLTNFSKLTVSAYSKNDETPSNLAGLLLPSGSIVPIQTNADTSKYDLLITPGLNLPSSITNVNGTVTIVVTVTGGNYAYTSSFPLTVVYSNLPPVVLASSSVWPVNENGGSVQATFFIYDGDTVIKSNMLSAYSADTTLLPQSNIMFGNVPTNGLTVGAWNAVTVMLTPARYAWGTNAVYMVATDGNSPVTNTVWLEVQHVYQSPDFTGLVTDYTNSANTAPITVLFGVTNYENVLPANLTVKVSAGNNNLETVSPVTANGAARSVTFTPVGSQSGSDLITATVTDTNVTPNKVTTTTFTVHFKAPPANFVGSAPFTLPASIPNTYPIYFTNSGLVGAISDVSLELRGLNYTYPAALDVLLVSPDGIPVMLMSGAGGPAAVPTPGLDVIFDANASQFIPVGGPLTAGSFQASDYTGGKHQLPTNGVTLVTAFTTNYNSTLQAFTNASPNGVWSLFINDLTGTNKGGVVMGAFLTVTTSPLITITNNPFVMTEDVSNALYFTVSDSTVPATNLSVVATVTKDTNNVFPVITVKQPDANGVGYVALPPAYLAHGWANINLTVTRGTDQISASTNVAINVSSVNFPPIVYRLLPQPTMANQTIPVQILISDIDTPLKNITVSAYPLTPSDAAIIPTNGLVFAGSVNNTNYIVGLTPTNLSTLGFVTLNITPNLLSPTASATIQIVVTDPIVGLTNSTIMSNLVVNVSQVFAPPVLANGFSGQQSVQAGGSLGLWFTNNTPNANTTTNLLLTVTSQDTTEVTNTAPVVLDPAAKGAGPWSVTFYGLPNAKGSSLITVVATDTVNGGKTTNQFNLAVTQSPVHPYPLVGGSGPITIKDFSAADVYPSQIKVTGLYGVINNVTVTLHGFEHQYPSDVGVLLVSPTNQAIVLMNRAGGANAINTPIDVTFDDAAGSQIPQGTPILPQSYRPFDYYALSGPYNFYPGSGITPPNGLPNGFSSSHLSNFVGSNPNGTWSLYVEDSVPLESGAITNGWSIAITTQPTFAGLTDVNIRENGTTNLQFSIGDDTPMTTPTFTWNISSNSVNSSLFTNGISVSGSGTNYVLTITPAPNQSGNGTITIIATDLAKFSVTNTINVTVPFTPQPPIVSFGATNYFPIAQGNAGSIPVSYSEPPNQHSPLTLQLLKSSNPSLLPLSGISIANSNQLGATFNVGPFINTYGVAVVTISVSDTNGLTTITNFTVNVTPVLNVFANTGLIKILDVAAANPYPSTNPVSANSTYGHILETKVTLWNFGHTYPQDVTVVLVSPAPNSQKIILMSKTASGPDTLPGVNLTFDSDPSYPKLPTTAPLVTGTYVPTCYNQNVALYTNNVPGPYLTNLSVFNGMTVPSGVWSLYVQDEAAGDVGAITNGWSLTFVTDAPVILPIADQTVQENGNTNVTVQVQPTVKGIYATNVIVTASVNTGSESPLGLISNPGSVVTTGPDSNGVVTLAISPFVNFPSAYSDPGTKALWPFNSNGTATVTVKAVDITSTNPPSFSTFKVTVGYVNQGPSFAGLVSSTNTLVNAPLVIGFTATDVDTPASSLMVGIMSNSNPALATAQLKSNGAAQSLTVQPSGNTGSVSITITNYDPLSQLTATQTVTVAMVIPTPPVLGPIATISQVAGSPARITLNITPTSVALSNITASFTSSTNAVTITNVSASDPTLAIATPAPGFVGSANCTATIWDGFTKVSQPFTINFTQPAAPTFPALASASVQVGSSTNLPLGIVQGDVSLSNLLVNAWVLAPNIATATVQNNSTVLITGVQFGTTRVFVSVNDQYNTPITNSFTVTVNNPQFPTWEAITNQVVTPFNTNATVTLAITAGYVPSSNWTFTTYIQSNVVSSLLATNNGTNVTLTFIVATNKFGSETNWITLSDGYSQATQQTIVTVLPPGAPILTNIATQSVQVGGVTTVILPLQVGIIPLPSLVITPTPADPSLVSAKTSADNTSVVLSGLKMGTTTVQVTVNDGYNTNPVISQTFTVNVLAPTAPVWGPITNVVIAAYNTPVSITIPVTSTVTPIGNLHFGAVIETNVVSSVVPTVTATGVIETFNIVKNAYGSETVTLTMSDGFTTQSLQTVVVVVQPTAPVLSPIGPKTTYTNTPLLVPLTISSPDIALSNLTYGATFDPNYVMGVTFATNGPVVSATVNVGANIGPSDVTITVGDGFSTSSQTFLLRVVQPGSLALAPIPAQSTVVDVPETVVLNITSPVVPVGGLIITPSHTNYNLVTSLPVNPVGNTMQVVINLAAKQTGSDYITITVNDGINQLSQSFPLMVTGPSITPVIVNGSLGIGFQAAPNSVYNIQSATSLFGPWTTVQTVTADSTGIVTYLATLNASVGGHFYRAQLKP